MHKHLLHATAGDGYGLQELDDTEWIRHYNAQSYHFKKNVLKCDFEPVVKAKELPLALKKKRTVNSTGTMWSKTKLFTTFSDNTKLCCGPETYVTISLN